MVSMDGVGLQCRESQGLRKISLQLGRSAGDFRKRVFIRNDTDGDSPAGIAKFPTRILLRSLAGLGSLKGYLQVNYKGY